MAGKRMTRLWQWPVERMNKAKELPRSVKNRLKRTNKKEKSVEEGATGDAVRERNGLE